ncbi:CbtA family protein [Micropruina sonneratiae]|uniref:CbtA family protein n=1 Tax=Micropruina sonneratiae TaxID=2986940 RepID=UPI00222751FD|nr:CbtA family protein [Micropruina sp. KQZ13P-5]MCW3158780.1 CbtA family protein [Micropruina sp. KQZ13P-5]
MLTPREFLVRGLLAGLIAGVAAFVVGYVVGGPSVGASIAIEEAGGGHSHGDEAEAPAEAEDEGTVVPRDLQSTLGLATGTLVMGTALGGLAGIMTGVAFGRFGRRSARSTALAVAGTAFTVFYVVPYLIYPPNPPAVGLTETIGYRTGLYVAMLAISIVAAVLGLYLARMLRGRLGAWYAGLVGVGGYAVIIIIALLVLPRYNEVPDDFPATVLFAFRQASVITQAVLWGVIGVVLGELTHRLMVRGAAATPVPATVG